MQFEWDRNKSLSNLEKHGISFDDAIALWRSPVLKLDTAPRSDEVRKMEIGTIGGKHWTAITTPRDPRTRIISVRRSRNDEKEAYDEWLRENGYS